MLRKGEVMYVEFCVKVFLKMLNLIVFVLVIISLGMFLCFGLIVIFGMIFFLSRV